MRVPYHATFESVNRRLRETGSLTRATMNRRRTTRTTGNKEAVLPLAEDNQLKSIRAITQQQGILECNVWRILAANKMSAHNLQRVTLLNPEDYPLHKAFGTWFLQRSATDRTFAASVFFTHEVYFKHGGVFNQHNAHVWALENPHITQPRAAQERFIVNVWAGIFGDYVIGPYLLSSRLDGTAYRIFCNMFCLTI